MVTGIEIFKEFFKDYTDNYIIIGGTACDILIENAGFEPRATNDIDLIVMIEALSPEFVTQFWKFIKAGDYQIKQKDNNKKNSYRFLNPQTPNFPVQIELFSRVPDAIDLAEFSHLTPIPFDEGLSNLSAILLNDEYYKFTRKNSIVENDIRYANTETIICLKAFAYLDNKKRKEAGENVRTVNITKHKNDIFRLVMLLNAGDNFLLPDKIKTDLNIFAKTIKTDLPDAQILKKNGFGKQDIEQVFTNFIDFFNLNID